MLRNFYVLFFVLFFLFTCTCIVTSGGTHLTTKFLSCTYDGENSPFDFNIKPEPFLVSFSGRSSLFYPEGFESHFMFSTNFISTNWQYVDAKSIYFVFNITFFSLNHINSNSLKLFCTCMYPELRSHKSTLASLSRHPSALAPNFFFK